MITKQDRYIAASAYFFESGYFLSFMLHMQKASPFISFHFKQAERLIGFLIVPSLVLLGLGVYTDYAIFGWAAMLCFIGYIVTGIIGAIYSLQGKMKFIF